MSGRVSERLLSLRVNQGEHMFFRDLGELGVSDANERFFLQGGIACTDQYQEFHTSGISNTLRSTNF